MDKFTDYDSYIVFMNDLYNRADGYHIGYETMGIPTEEFESKAKEIRDILIAIKEGLSQ